MKTFTYLLLFFSLTLSSVSAFADKWEYKAKSYLLISDDQYITDELNKLGAQGWQLISCTATNKGGKVLCTFTRKKAK